jgi:hypothetical protein
MLRRDVLVGALILVVAGGRPPGRRIRPRPRSPSSMSASGDPGGSDDYDEADLGWADRAVAPGRIGGSGGAGLRRGEPRVLLPDRHPATRHRARTRVQLEQSKNREGRESELSAAVEWPVLPRWQIELEVPFVINFPSDGATTGGPGDREIENKLLLYRSVEGRILVSAGFATTVPSGSEPHPGGLARRSLRGEPSLPRPSTESSLSSSTSTTLRP